MAQMISWCKDGTTTQDDEPTLLSKYIGRWFENMDKIPPWRDMVCSRGPDALSVSFVFNHTIGDGTSGRIFLTDFAKALTAACPGAEESMVVVNIPEEIPISPSLESMSHLRLGAFFFFFPRYLVAEVAKSIASADEFTLPVNVQVARLRARKVSAQRHGPLCAHRRDHLHSLPTQNLRVRVRRPGVGNDGPSDAGDPGQRCSEKLEHERGAAAVRSEHAELPAKPDRQPLQHPVFASLPPRRPASAVAVCHPGWPVDPQKVLFNAKPQSL